MPPSPPETEDRDANLRLNKFPGRNLRSLFPSWKSRPKLSPEERRKILVEILPQGAAWATFVRRFYTLLAISVLIATMGLATDSAAVIIGAMLIAPMMMPIMGLGVALVLGWWRHQVRLILFITLGSLFTVGLGFAVMLVYQAPHGMPIPSQVLERTHPGVGDLGVALCAGLAAAYMQVRRETLSALPGVAISVALVPPLASAGVLIYFGEYDLMWGAVLLFVTNASAIVLSASMLFLAMGVKPPIKDKQLSLKVAASNAVAMIAVVLVAIPLVLQTLNVFQGIREHTVAVVTVRQWIIHDSVVMKGVQVRGNKVEIDLRLDMPLAAFGPQESLKPRRWIPPDMNESQLEKSLSKALQRNIQVSLTGQFQLTN